MSKELQVNRIRGYFIQATKEILKGEGIKCVNVRNIAQQAGYSYATLYNYFKDVKELVFECVKDFQQECEETVKSETTKSKRGLVKIETITSSYMKFFVQYPGIFELFFMEKTSDIAHNKPTINIINQLLDKLCNDEWNYCIDNKIISKTEAELKKESLRITSVGLLLFYLNRYQPTSYKEFTEITKRQLKNILR